MTLPAPSVLALVGTTVPLGAISFRAAFRSTVLSTVVDRVAVTDASTSTPVAASTGLTALTKGSDAGAIVTSWILVLVPPLESRVRNPSVTVTVTAAVVDRTAAVGTKPATASTPSTVTR
jgi:hypothetical protein